jgi:hypothetical protein
MTLYAIFTPRPGKPAAPVAVPEKFSFLAALLPPVFAIVHGLWLELIAFIVLVVALAYLGDWIGSSATAWLYLALALWCGLAAASLRRHGLAWRGWSHRGDVVASNADLARLSFLQAAR